MDMSSRYALCKSHMHACTALIPQRCYQVDAAESQASVMLLRPSRASAAIACTACPRVHYSCNVCAEAHPSVITIRMKRTYNKD